MRVLTVLIASLLVANAADAQLDEIYDLGVTLAQDICRGEKSSVKEIQSSSEPNDSSYAIFRTVRCKSGLKQLILSPSVNDTNGALVWVSIYRTNPRLPAYLQIGAPISELNRALGQPSKIEGKSLRYIINESESELIIDHSRGKIKSVTWGFYAG